MPPNRAASVPYAEGKQTLFYQECDMNVSYLRRKQSTFPSVAKWEITDPPQLWGSSNLRVISTIMVNHKIRLYDF